MTSAKKHFAAALFVKRALIGMRPGPVPMTAAPAVVAR
jgi:hypothetical protein